MGQPELVPGLDLAGLPLLGCLCFSVCSQYLLCLREVFMLEIRQVKTK